MGKSSFYCGGLVLVASAKSQNSSAKTPLDKVGKAAEKSSKPIVRTKFLTWDGGIKRGSKSSAVQDQNHQLYNKKSKGKIDLSLYSKDSRAKRDLRKGLADVKSPTSGKSINWGKLDQTGKPKITFSPGAAERDEYIRLLLHLGTRASVEDKRTKKQLESKLTTEFIRLYKIYRAEVNRSKGRRHCSYEVLDSERRFALRASIACIVKAVTPRQVLEYWHERIHTFANCNLDVPPLTFLTAANIDQVAIHAMANKHGKPSTVPPRRQSAAPPSRHTMSDTGLLHPDFRAALTEQGFDLSDMNNQYLTTVQAYAVDVAGGYARLNSIPSKLRDMVSWAAEHFFDGKDLRGLI